jgi:hypothetical protein
MGSWNTFRWVILDFSSAHYSPLLDIGISNFSPSRSIFGYVHPAPASRPPQIVTPSGLRASYTTLTETRSPLQKSLPKRLSVLQLIWPAHYHFSMLIWCAKSVNLKTFLLFNLWLSFFKLVHYIATEAIGKARSPPRVKRTYKWLRLNSIDEFL